MWEKLGLIMLKAFCKFFMDQLIEQAFHSVTDSVYNISY